MSKIEVIKIRKPEHRDETDFGQVLRFPESQRAYVEDAVRRGIYRYRDPQHMTGKSVVGSFRGIGLSNPSKTVDK